MKNIILLIVLGILAFSASVSAQATPWYDNCDPSAKTGDWRVSHYPVSFDMNASLMHVAGSAYLANSFEKIMPWWKADLAVLSLGLLWEVKDGFVPWEQAGALGGEGFSSNDFKMDLLGVVINRMLPSVLEKSFSAVKNFDSSKYSLGFSGGEYPKVQLSVGM